MIQKKLKNTRNYLLHNVKLIKSKILRLSRILSSKHRIKHYLENIYEKNLIILEKCIKCIKYSKNCPPSGIELQEFC